LPRSRSQRCWSLRTRLSPLHLFGSYLVLSGTARFLVEFLRTNDEVLLGATQPQPWSLLLIVIGAGLLESRRASDYEPESAPTSLESAAESGGPGQRSPR
jgi:phosphatidylglycerol:prolipoprotein diacylglycerol transferase